MLLQGLTKSVLLHCGCTFFILLTDHRSHWQQQRGLVCCATMHRSQTMRKLRSQDKIHLAPQFYQTVHGGLLDAYLTIADDLRTIQHQKRRQAERTAPRTETRVAEVLLQRARRERDGYRPEVDARRGQRCHPRIVG